MRSDTSLSWRAAEGSGRRLEGDPVSRGGASRPQDHEHGAEPTQPGLATEFTSAHDTPRPPLDEPVEIDADALPAAAGVLSETGTGVFHWDVDAGTVVLDAEAARLMGLPARPVRLSVTAARARVHPEDWNEIDGIAHLAYAEDTVGEVRVRVTDEHGREVRVVRGHFKPYLCHGAGDDGDRDRRDRGNWGPDSGIAITGTIQEVTAGPEGSPAASGVTGDWRRSREAFLLDAGRALAEAGSTAEVLRVAACLSMPGFTMDGLAVFGVRGDRLVLIGDHGHRPGDRNPFLDLRRDAAFPAADVIRTGRPVYLSSPGEYQERYPAAWTLAQRFGRKSWAFMPLTVGGTTIGAWLAAFAYPVRFTPDERAVLTTVARMLAQALSRAGAAESEKALADNLQRSMLPSLGPRVPGLGLAARHVPGGGGLQVGGDWYDAIPLPSGHIALVIGDVQGHDVRAAGLMGQLRIALRAYATEGHRPDAVLSRAGRFVAGIMESTCRESAHGEGRRDPPDDRFATCLYIDADPATGALEIARAGHLDPVVRTADGTILKRPTSGGLPLGIDPDVDYPVTRLVLEPGETMLTCTDGLIETGGHDVITGWKRINHALEQHGGRNLEALADALVGAVHGPSSHHTPGPLMDRREDDIAVLLLRRTGVPAPSEATRRAALGIGQSEPERIADARHQLRQLLHDWPSDEQVDSAELLVSELLTNVLRHTDGDAWLVAEVGVRSGQRYLRAEVTDSSDDLPHRREPGELASSGRGLVLTEFLADAWGVAPRGAGKSIWFELCETDATGSGATPEADMATPEAGADSGAGAGIGVGVGPPGRRSRPGDRFYA